MNFFDIKYFNSNLKFISDYISRILKSQEGWLFCIFKAQKKIHISSSIRIWKKINIETEVRNLWLTVKTSLKSYDSLIWHFFTFIYLIEELKMSIVVVFSGLLFWWEWWGVFGKGKWNLQKGRASDRWSPGLRLRIGRRSSVYRNKQIPT